MDGHRADGSQSDALGELIGWTARTSWGLARIGFGLVRQLPGGAEVERGFRTVERAIATGARQWLEEVESHSEEETDPAPDDPDDQTEDAPKGQDLRERMGELLYRSAMTGREEATEDLYSGILRLITPDEARILAGLGDGSSYPVLHVAERGVVGGNARIVLRNGSTVGRSVGVSLAEETPHYLTRLQSLGLVEIGPALPDVDDQYELLQTDTRVREALSSPKPTKVVRRSVRMSALGTRFWQRCDPSSELGAG
ncbi:Abi-alpha family protein [Saccharopolyspora sp. WRP15-2]|uniref:Abi-alpha family protein n=1 Tax=Saccharopolyspora oryzae TaxID=2997343 RepID=A0ABT4UZP9_9PSEU|nr:Abi-alpha family protein [Saccharopolyspora oryzae]MDA3627192.1 Abi-alpha family protein [Saccharopolyspora oryzae]